MKKKLFRVLALIIIIVICVTAMTACKSAEEKEKDYYAEISEDMAKASEVIDAIGEKMNTANFTAKFSIINKEYNGVSRGTPQEAGWKRNYTDAEGNMVDYSWMVSVVDYEIVWESTEKIYVYAKVYETVDEDTYDSVKNKNNYGDKLRVVSESKVVKSLSEHLSGTDITSLPLMAMNNAVYREKLAADGLSMDKGNKIYTNILRVNMREVYDSERIKITREINDSKKDKFDILSDADATGDSVKYWSGYGEDISYNWNKVYGMLNTRVTMSYNGKKVLKSFELYTEEIISYYAQKNTVDSSLILKADVFKTCEMVMNMQMPKKNQTFTVPQI